MERMKGIMGVLICGIVIMGMVMTEAEAEAAEGSDNVINYGVLGRNGAIGCSPKYPSQCQKPVANPYNRGCSPSLGCRTGG
ncbi:hypothetical protein K1719_022881 [Acacia pycnantha]|nr:hypothetical protein K1719_022881 [Acacia pycnantha]